MNSQEFFKIIEEVAGAKGKEKQAIVAKHKDNKGFCQFLSAALNPFIRFHIANVPVPEKSGDGVFTMAGEWDDTAALLMALHTRKITGNEAREKLKAHMETLTPESQEVVRRIIRKDLRAGISESTVNKAIKGLIPSFPYMRCCLPKAAKLDKFDWQAGVFSQEKADGMFANINHEPDGMVLITSRQGSPFPQEPFELLAEEVRARLAPGSQNHGELLVKRNGVILPREQSNGILNRILKGGQFEDSETPVFFVWDQIPLGCVEKKGKYEVGYARRLASLIRQLKGTAGTVIQLVPTRIVHSLPAAYEHYKEMLREGKEGTIIKDRGAIWRDGTSKEQVKLKLEVEVDLEVVDFLPGEGKNAATFGSVLTRTSCGGLEVAVSGFTDAKRKEIHESRDSLVGTIMTVRANSIMNPANDGELHSLFLPRYVEFRTDKSEADSLQRVRDQFESAVSL